MGWVTMRGSSLFAYRGAKGGRVGGENEKKGSEKTNTEEAIRGGEE